MFFDLWYSIVGSINKTLVCEVLGAVVNPQAPVYTQSKPIHKTQCSLSGFAAVITEIPPEKFNMGKFCDYNIVFIAHKALFTVGFS